MKSHTLCQTMPKQSSQPTVPVNPKRNNHRQQHEDLDEISKQARELYPTKTAIKADLDLLKDLFMSCQTMIYHKIPDLIWFLRNANHSDDQKIHKIYSVMAHINKRRTIDQFYQMLEDPNSSPPMEEAFGPLPYLQKDSAEWEMLWMANDDPKDTSVRYGFNWLTVLFRSYISQLYLLMVSAANMGLKKEAQMLLTPNRLQKRPCLPDLPNKPDELEARLDILILACIANVGFHDIQAPANAYSTPINGNYPITYVNPAFTEEWVKEVQDIRTNDNTKMTHEQMLECFVKEGGPEKANQLLKKHEWTKTKPNPQFRFVGQKWKNKNLVDPKEHQQ